MTTEPIVGSVSAFFPCYNDAPTIAKMVDDVDSALASTGIDYEIIVTNDGSKDDSAAVLERLQAANPRLRVVTHEVNRGYGGALISGFGAATKDWIFYTDGDAQYDASEITSLLAAARPDTDVVQGWKMMRGDPWYRWLIGRTYHYTVRFAFNLHVKDTDCDFRLFKRSLITQRPLTSTSGVICVEMMRTFEQADARFVQVGVHHYHRPAGRSQFFRLPAIARSFRQLGELWWRLMVRGRRGA